MRSEASRAPSRPSSPTDDLSRRPQFLLHSLFSFFSLFFVTSFVTGRGSGFPSNSFVYCEGRGGLNQGRKVARSLGRRTLDPCCRHAAVALSLLRGQTDRGAPSKERTERRIRGRRRGRLEAAAGRITLLSRLSDGLWRRARPTTKSRNLTEGCSLNRELIQRKHLVFRFSLISFLFCKLVQKTANGVQQHLGVS